jgi:hypothetical protein
LASDDARYMTGSIVYVDDGLSLSRSNFFLETCTVVSNFQKVHINCKNVEVLTKKEARGRGGRGRSLR